MWTWTIRKKSNSSKSVDTMQQLRCDALFPLFQGEQLRFPFQLPPVGDLADEGGLFHHLVQQGIGFAAPGNLLCRLLHGGAAVEWKEVEEHVVKGVDNLLQEIDGSAVAHEGGAERTTHDGAGEACRNEPAFRVKFGQIDFIDNSAEEELRLFLLNLLADEGVVGFGGIVAEEALHPHLSRQKGFEAEGVGFCSGGTEPDGREPLRLWSAPEIPEWLEGGAFLLLQKGLGLLLPLQEATKVVNKIFGFANAEGGLQHRTAKLFRQSVAEFMVHHHQHIGVFQIGNVVQRTFKGVDMQQLSSHSSNEPLDFGQI